MGPGFEPLRVYNVTAEAVQVCIIFWFKIDALLAQLVEQLTLNQWVQGSSPWECTKSAALSQGKAADFFVSGLSHSPFSIRIFLPRKTRQPSTILTILLNIKRIKVTSWKHKPVTTLHLCWVGAKIPAWKFLVARRKFLLSAWYFLLSAQKKFVTKFVTLVTKFLIHVTKFVIHVTNFVTKTFLYDSKKYLLAKEKFQAGSKN